ncbi:hypothetical protein V2J09_004036 [Rumex salicifolius]
MDASNYMDKQIMDLSRSKISYSNHDLIDLMKPLPIDDDDDEKAPGALMNEDNHRSYDSQTIHSVRLPSRFSHSPPMGGGGAPRVWNSDDTKSNYSPTRSYGYLGSIESDKAVLEKAQKANETAILSDIDCTMKRYTDNVLHAIDGLSARLSQLEARTRQIELSVDDLKVSVGNNYGSTDGKTRHIENIILEVKSCVQDLKDKQEIMNAQIQLQKLQVSKVNQTPETQNATRFKPPEQQSPAQESYQQFSVSYLQSLPSIPPNAPPPPQPSIQPPAQMQNHYPPTSMPSVPQRDTYQPPAGTTQEAPLPPASMPTVPQRDTYQPPAGPTQEVPNQQYSLPPSHQQHPPPGVHQQYQPGPPSPYPQQPSQQPTTVHAPTPQAHPPMAQAPHTYPFQQPSSQPTSVPPPSHQFYNASQYIPPTNPTDRYAYGGPSSNYGKNPAIKPQPHSSASGGYYGQIPTAKILPQAVPTAASSSAVGGGGGNANRVRIDDVVDKVSNMGFTREQVNATVCKLTENGQPVDLNVVLDKLMSDVYI